MSRRRLRHTAQREMRERGYSLDESGQWRKKRRSRARPRVHSEGAADTTSSSSEDSSIANHDDEREEEDNERSSSGERRDLLRAEQDAEFERCMQLDRQEESFRSFEEEAMNTLIETTDKKKKVETLLSVYLELTNAADDGLKLRAKQVMETVVASLLIDCYEDSDPELLSIFTRALTAMDTTPSMINDVVTFLNAAKNPDPTDWQYRHRIQYLSKVCGMENARHVAQLAIEHWKVMQ